MRITDIENPKPAYWAVLPATVRYDKDLSASAKLLYAEISALSGKTGFCFAGNEYLMKLFDVSERTLQRHLKELEARGLIQIIDGDGGAGRRKIFAGINSLANPVKNVGVAPSKMSANPVKNVAHINKSIKKEEQEPPIVPQRGTSRRSDVPDYMPELFESFWKSFPPMKGGRKPAKARARAAWNKLRPDRSTVDEMATALRRQKTSEQWRAGIGIPYASTWLNQRMWEEEFVEAAPQAEEPSGRRDLKWL